MRVVIACAGTGGHINPAISIANTICLKEPDSQVLFIGTKTGLENELVEKAGYKLAHIRTGKLLRSLTIKNISAIYNSLLGIKDAKKILKEFKPDLVIGTGGYICVPVMMAAKGLKIPYVLHESNAFPGLTIKLMAKNAACVMIGFEEARKRLKDRKNIVYTGTPIKFSKYDINRLNADKCKEELKLTSTDIGKDRKIILVTGGSQGAKKINKTVIDMIAKFKDEKLYFVLAVGHKNYDQIIEEINEISSESNIDFSKYLRVEKYIYDMVSMYRVADLCITRSGAITINELMVAGKPSILIPLPYATENHQLYNAKVLEDVNAASVIIETDLTIETLYNIVNKITSSTKKLGEMSANARKCLKNDVDNIIYDCIKKVYNR